MEKELASPGLSTRGIAMLLLLILGLIFGYRYCFSGAGLTTTVVINTKPEAKDPPKQDNMIRKTVYMLISLDENSCYCTNPGAFCWAKISRTEFVCPQDGDYVVISDGEGNGCVITHTFEEGFKSYDFLRELPLYVPRRQRAEPSRAPIQFNYRPRHSLPRYAPALYTSGGI